MNFAPWQQRVFERAIQARAAGRLPHALLICGPERLGKRALAEALAQSLLCMQPQDSGAQFYDGFGCHFLTLVFQPDSRPRNFSGDKPALAIARRFARKLFNAPEAGEDPGKPDKPGKPRGGGRPPG